ncbi:MAG: PLDc N-terminal domain-containing protein [Gaiellaceae bacterium]
MFLTIIYVLIIAFIVALWAYSIYDLIRRLRRNQISGWHFAIWLVVVIVLPAVGSLTYAIVRPAPPMEETS